MNILHLANGYFGNRLYENLFSALETVGVQNKVYVPLAKHQRVTAETHDNVVVSNCFSQVDRLLFFSKQNKITRDLKKRLRLDSFNLVHAHTLFSAGYAALQIKKQYGIPYVVAVRNTDVNVFFKRMIHLRRTGVTIMRNASQIVFLSPAYQANVLKKYVPNRYRKEIEKKCVTIPNGISQLFFENLSSPRLIPNKDSVRLIYVGEINSNKNIELTIQAAELLKKRGYAVTLTAVGAITEDKYSAIIKESVAHYERCSQEKVLAHLRSADIFVMPSHAETFGLVYAEAMSQGLPVLYTRGQGFDGHFSDGTVGYAVSDQDPQELADRIETIIANYEVLSENCVRLVDRFDWLSIAKQYRQLYQIHMGEVT